MVNQVKIHADSCRNTRNVRRNKRRAVTVAAYNVPAESEVDFCDIGSLMLLLGSMLSASHQNKFTKTVQKICDLIFV